MSKSERKPEPGEFYCRKHDQEINPDAGKCPKCGIELARKPKPGEFYCKDHSQFTSDVPGECANCGADLVQARGRKNAVMFTDVGITRLRPTKEQDLYWDTVQKGLALLVSPGGTKTFRSQYKLSGKWLTRTLGRYGELPDDGGEGGQLVTARAMARKDRMLAADGINPKQPNKPKEEEVSPLYGDVVDDFIEEYAKPRQRTWDQTQWVLKVKCKAWLDRPIDEITTKDADNLLKGIVAKGHGPTAGLTLRWLKAFWRWAKKKRKVAAPIMDEVEIEYEKRTRKRVFSDDEIKAIWKAAEQLDPNRSHPDPVKRNPYPEAFVKLLVLLSPRKTALAHARWSHLDDPENPTHWTTPHELTKTKKSVEKERTYRTPLPPLAQRILKELPKREDAPTLLFPGRKKGEPLDPGSTLTKKLSNLGAPEDFNFHAIRHTVATWLENKGHSEYERGLILNHSASGVTAGYSHGYSLDLKLQLLTKWADHVERLIATEGVSLLR